MRRLILCILLVMFWLSLIADTSGDEQITFGLISAPEYFLDLRLSNSLNRVFVTAEFTIEPDQTDTNNYYSFFISKDARIEQLFVNAKRSFPLLTTNLTTEHFSPSLSVPALLDSTSLVVCYSIAKEALMQNPTTIKLIYWLPIPEWHPTSDGKQVIGFMADEYWFPRNIEYDSTVNVTLQTTVRHKLEIDTPCTYLETDGIRLHKGCFRDGIDKSAYVKIIRG